MLSKMIHMYTTFSKEDYYLGGASFQRDNTWYGFLEWQSCHSYAEGYGFYQNYHTKELWHYDFFVPSGARVTCFPLPRPGLSVRLVISIGLFLSFCSFSYYDFFPGESSPGDDIPTTIPRPVHRRSRYSKHSIEKGSIYNDK